MLSEELLIHDYMQFKKIVVRKQKISARMPEEKQLAGLEKLAAACRGTITVMKT